MKRCKNLWRKEKKAKKAEFESSKNKDQPVPSNKVLPQWLLKVYVSIEDLSVVPVGTRWG